MNKILKVKDLNIDFKTKKGLVNAVSSVSYDLYEGQIVGIVGESGCGKTVSTMSLPRLLSSNGVVCAEEVLLGGKDLMKISDKEIRGIRGRDISVIFQEPMSALNPSMKLGNQILENVLIHEKIPKDEAIKQVKRMMEKVLLSNVDEIYNSYPHQLSGGMLQRVMIAMAMVCEPKILIADEPTTALDVTIQVRILHLMKKLNSEQNTSIILISHDIGVIKEICDEVIVMYLGQLLPEIFLMIIN